MIPTIEINKTFWECLNTDKRYVHSYGGRGSGKSRQEAIGFVLDILKPEYFKGVMVREIQGSIRNSQFAEINSVISGAGLESLIHSNESRMEFYCPETGNTIISQGLKKSKSTDTAQFKSIENPTKVWVEEAEEISRTDFEKIDGSIRKKGAKCQIRFTYNTSIDEEHWLRKDFHETKREDSFYLHTTYLDNVKFLDAEYIKTREEIQERDPDRYLVEVKGAWGHKQVIAPFANQYDPNKHRKPCEYVPNIPLHLTLDFNLDPFAFIYRQMWRDKFGWHLHYFKEETIEDGDINEACKRIKDIFKGQLHTMTVTGDYSGTHRNMTEADKASMYKLLRRSLGLRENQLDIKPNPTHKNSRSDVNYLLMHFPDLRISPSCVYLDRDLRTVEINPEGKLIKDNRKVGSQKADHLDAFRYDVNGKAIQYWIKQHQKTNY